MKKILAVLASLLLAATLSAQDHLKFEGMALEGPYDTFTRIMRRNGFKFTGKDPREPFMRGKVFGEQADVTILVTPRTYQVYMVMVSYPRRTGWQTLKNQYDSMKLKLYARYGEPVLTMEQFRERELNKAADIVRANLDMESVYKIIKGGDAPLGRWKE